MAPAAGADGVGGWWLPVWVVCAMLGHSSLLPPWHCHYIWQLLHESFVHTVYVHKATSMNDARASPTILGLPISLPWLPPGLHWKCGTHHLDRKIPSLHSHRWDYGHWFVLCWVRFYYVYSFTLCCSRSHATVWYCGMLFYAVFDHKTIL